MMANTTSLIARHSLRPIQFLALAAMVAACDGTHDAASSDSATDTAFASMQARGADAMGVDQATSTHLFDARPDGGRIELQRNVDDSVGVATIRTHLRDIAASFSSGDFSTPELVHMKEVPGSAVMIAKRAQINYAYRDLPRGGEVVITSRDPDALKAIAEFMEFQRHEHRAGGMNHGAHSGMSNSAHDMMHDSSKAPPPAR